MSKVPVVKINTDYVAQFLATNGISGAEFGKSLGYSDHWWASVIHKKNSVKPNVAKLICGMYKLDIDKLLVKETEPAIEPETLTVDGEVVEAFGKWLERVESKLDKLLSLWGES